MIGRITTTSPFGASPSTVPSSARPRTARTVIPSCGAMASLPEGVVSRTVAMPGPDRTTALVAAEPSATPKLSAASTTRPVPSGRAASAASGANSNPTAAADDSSACTKLLGPEHPGSTGTGPDGMAMR